MTNPILSNDITNSRVITWQYDKAWNLINLISKWNAWATISVSDFWDNVLYNVLTCKVSYKTRKEWGENVSYKVGNEIRVETTVYRCKVEHVSDSENKPPNTDYWEVVIYDTFGLTVWGGILGIPRPKLVIPDASNPTITNIVPISDDLYYRLLHARFYLMYHSPTIINYNEYLHILFPGDDETGKHTRNKVLSFGDCGFTDSYTVAMSSGQTRTVKGAVGTMSMGFTFPSPAPGKTQVDDEEAYLIFQHYDVCYPFPAAIRTNCSFSQTDYVIGFDGQNYNNFAEGFAYAYDTTKNGGILSTTEGANYYVAPNRKGIVYIVSTSSMATEKTSNLTFELSGTVWIDWGDGDNNYRSVTANTPLSHTYAYDGNFAIAVYGMTPRSDPSGTIKSYTL